MEKLKPTHDLEAFKRAFALQKNMSVIAFRNAEAIGYSRAEVLDVVASIGRRDFVKSVTSFGDHRHWHDVYNVPHRGQLLYLKFTDHTLTEFILLSFKRK